MKRPFFVFLLILLAFNLFAQPEKYPHDAYVRGEKVRLRQEANAKSALLEELAFGAPVKVLQCTKKSEIVTNSKIPHFWVEVQTASGKVGWVYGEYLGVVPNNIQKDYFRKEKAFKYKGQDFYLKGDGLVTSDYTDYQSDEYGWGQDAVLFFMTPSEPNKPYFIRNTQTNDKKKALNNYWSLPTSCCALSDFAEDYIQSGDKLYIIWKQENGDDEAVDKRLIVIKATEKGFVLEEELILSK